MTLEMLKQRRSSATSDHETIRNAATKLARMPLEVLFSEKNSELTNASEFFECLPRVLGLSSDDMLPENLAEVIAVFKRRQRMHYVTVELMSYLAALHEGYMIDTFGGFRS